MARNVKCSVSGKWGTSDTFIKIDGKYYCNKDDQINCCQKIIQFLEKADEKNYN